MSNEQKVTSNEQRAKSNEQKVQSHFLRYTMVKNQKAVKIFVYEYEKHKILRTRKDKTSVVNN